MTKKKEWYAVVPSNNDEVWEVFTNRKEAKEDASRYGGKVICLIEKPVKKRINKKDK